MTEKVNSSSAGGSSASSSKEERHKPVRLRYVGFEHVKSLRVYRYEQISPGEEATAFIVSSDLTLFAKHGVGLQEGPVLCLHLLLDELEAAEGRHAPPFDRRLTDRHMLAHLASKCSRGTKTRPT